MLQWLQFEDHDNDTMASNICLTRSFGTGLSPPQQRPNTYISRHSTFCASLFFNNSVLPIVLAVKSLKPSSWEHGRLCSEWELPLNVLKYLSDRSCWRCWNITGPWSVLKRNMAAAFTDVPSSRRLALPLVASVLARWKLWEYMHNLQKLYSLCGQPPFSPFVRQRCQHSPNTHLMPWPFIPPTAAGISWISGSLIAVAIKASGII
jgi:hypothetical protein